MTLSFLLIGLNLLMIAALWTLMEKTGRPGWYALIPVWNIYQLVKIVGWRGYSMALLVVPIVNIFYLVGLSMHLAKAFGKGEGFGIGIALFPILFLPMLAFGEASYEGQSHERNNPEYPLGEYQSQEEAQRNADEPDRSTKTTGHWNEAGEWVEEIPLQDW